MRRVQEYILLVNGLVGAHPANFVHQKPPGWLIFLCVVNRVSSLSQKLLYIFRRVGWESKLLVYLMVLKGTRRLLFHMEAPSTDSCSYSSVNVAVFSLTRSYLLTGLLQFSISIVWADVGGSLR